MNIGNSYHDAIEHALHRTAMIQTYYTVCREYGNGLEDNLYWMTDMSEVVDIIRIIGYKFKKEVNSHESW
jgi:predicted membrane-bound dolichyl-phosphate-mannose-protein mannosyltransferase